MSTVREHSMEPLTEQDLLKLKELLRHAGEFIAYFELAESKMISWRQDIEHQTREHQLIITKQLGQLQEELQSLQEVLTQAGLARLRLSAEQTLQQGETLLGLMQKTSQQILADIGNQHREFNKMLGKNLTLIEQHTTQSIARIDCQLNEYDVNHFRRTASESCEQVEKVATRALQKCATLVRSFEWRAISIALIASISAAFAIGLYANNEWPWEMHQHARSEREAGRTLMKIWPMLSQQEKNKFLLTNQTEKN